MKTVSHSEPGWRASTPLREPVHPDDFFKPLWCPVGKDVRSWRCKLHTREQQDYCDPKQAPLVKSLGCGTGEMCPDNASRNFGCAFRNPVPVAKSRFVHARRFLGQCGM